MRSRFATAVLIVLGVMIALVVNATLFAGVMAYRAYRHGAAVVRVHEKRPDGVNLWIPVPVSLATTALHWIPSEDLPPMDPEVARVLPTVRAIAEELDRMPDAVLVEVEGPHEWVRIAKEGGRLVIEVDDSDTRVHVTLPAGSLGEIVGQVQLLARRAPSAPASPSSWALPEVPPAPPVPPVPGGVV